MDNESKLFALLHDAAEYVIGDMISPLKSHVGVSYEELDVKVNNGNLYQVQYPCKKN